MCTIQFDCANHWTIAFSYETWCDNNRIRILSAERRKKFIYASLTSHWLRLPYMQLVHNNRSEHNFPIHIVWEKMWTISGILHDWSSSVSLYSAMHQETHWVGSSRPYLWNMMGFTGNGIRTHQIQAYLHKIPQTQFFACRGHHWIILIVTTLVLCVHIFSTIRTHKHSKVRNSYWFKIHHEDIRLFCAHWHIALLDFNIYRQWHINNDTECIVHSHFVLLSWIKSGNKSKLWF